MSKKTSENMANAKEKLANPNNSEKLASAMVKVEDFAKALQLDILSPGSKEYMNITSSNINRPGLLLAGFEDYFGKNRLQVIGNAEHFYLEKFDSREKVEKLHALFEQSVPCLILTRGITPCEEMVNAAMTYDVPLLVTSKVTSHLVMDLSAYISELLAPTMSTHGVLLEVSGLGVLLIGNNGMGKSETALELIHRGHRLVADDAVLLKKVKNKLIGLPPEKIKHFMEIRGIGIIDVCNMFGVGSVLDQKDIDLVIELEEWNSAAEQDRLILNDTQTDFLGVKVPILHIPVKAGRNLAIVVEVACRNQRLKQLGFDALQELLNRCNMER